MKIIRKSAAAEKTESPLTPPPRIKPWKVMVIDDEPDIRQLTALNLRGFEFAGRPLQLIEAASAAEARACLAEHPDIALALVDVVMETDDAGLRLVEYIRKDLGNVMIRLVIRTGQPGIAPERFVIDNFDIDDYKDKTELTVQKLYTTVRSALKGYRDLLTIEMNRAGLNHILNVTPELYNLHRDKLEDYFRGLLIQIIGICNLGTSGLISTIDGLVLTMEGQDIRIRAGAGDLEADPANEERRKEIVALCSQAVTVDQLPTQLPTHLPTQLRDGALVVPLQVHGAVIGFIYLETHADISASDLELIQIMANQCAAALENFHLHHSLEESYDEAIDMLGQVAEFKDSATGTHIRRIQAYTHRLAVALGCSETEAARYGKASRLHDVGKVGIPDSILRKPGALNEEEYNIMKRHSLIGDSILARSSSLSLARAVARSHHERWNGSGYPDGLSGEKIPFVARLVAVVDVFDALVSTRPYKGPWQAKEAVQAIAEGSGRNFEPRIVAAFMTLIESGQLDDLIVAATQPPEPAAVLA
jgi:response regulator RpfG family c-di-GMP phosphodiesterase